MVDPSTTFQPKPYLKTIAWILFLVQGALCCCCHAALGNFRVTSAPDSEAYIQASRLPPFSDKQLRHPRSVGYPLLLRSLEEGFGNLAWMAVVHAILTVVGCTSVFWALQLYAPNPWRRLLIASPLWYSEPFTPYYVRTLLTDLPAFAISLLALSCWLRTIVRLRAGYVLVLAASVFVCWQIRPTYQFLVVLLPLLTLLLTRPARLISASPTKRGDTWQTTLIVGMATFVPFLGFCGYRWSRVGEFGVVSFTGSQTIGITGQLLREEDVQRFPEGLRPVALAVLRGRDRLDPAQNEGRTWESPYAGGVAGPGVNAAVIIRQFDPVLWTGILPELYEGPLKDLDNVDADRLMRSFSLSFVSRNPMSYFKWWFNAVRIAIGSSLGHFSLTLLLLGSAAMAMFRMVRAFSAARSSLEVESLDCVVDAVFAFRFAILSIVAGSFWLVQCLLIPAFMVPMDRYVQFAIAPLSIPMVDLTCELWCARARLHVTRRGRELLASANHLQTSG